MYIDSKIWSPLLFRLPKIDAEPVENLPSKAFGDIQSDKIQYCIYIRSSDENTLSSIKHSVCRRVKEVFANSCHFVFDVSINRYRIYVCISDYYHCEFSFLNKNMKYLPKKAQEELIRQNFINISDDLISARKRGSIEKGIDHLFQNTFFMSKDRLETHGKPSSIDIRAYLHYLKKLNPEMQDINQLVNHEHLLSMVNIVNSHPAKNAMLIFSGSLSKLNGKINETTFRIFIYKPNFSFSNVTSAFGFYSRHVGLLQIRDAVYAYSIVKIQDTVNDIFESRKLDGSPSEISNLVTEYVQYPNLETFLEQSEPVQLIEFVDHCMDKLYPA